MRALLLEQRKVVGVSYELSTIKSNHGENEDTEFILYK
jgi:hypothetical protein